MRRHLRGLLAIIALSVGTPAGAEPGRTGYWIGGGAGWGSGDTSGTLALRDAREALDEERAAGMTLFLRVGRALSEKFSVGLAVDTWRASGEYKDTSLETLSATATYVAFSSFFVEGGAGLAHATLERGIETQSSVGLALIASIGYDIALGQRWAITPVVSFQYARPGSLEFAGGVARFEGLSLSVARIGVGVTFD